MGSLPSTLNLLFPSNPAKNPAFCSNSSMEGPITPRALKLIMGTFHHSIEVKCGIEIRFVHKEMYRQDKTRHIRR